jgi:hypothetical protein
MKVLDLRCAQGHGFEGWFASNDEFEEQLASKLLECPVCGSAEIAKLLSAPRLNLVGGSPVEPAQQQPARAALEARWLRAVREVIASTEDVGTRFADEARRMHYGEIAERGIRGQATREQAGELLDEGIAVMALPDLALVKETLQ